MGGYLQAASPWTVQCGMLKKSVIALLIAALPGLVGAANIPIEGGCVLGESQVAHGISPAQAEARIIQHARRYVQSIGSYNRAKVETRRRASAYLELKAWTQSDIIGFTRLQRELLYIRVAGELATSRIDTSDLPGYVAAIDQQIQDIEIELGCDMLPPEIE
jgi:hypothetical protein